MTYIPFFNSLEAELSRNPANKPIIAISGLSGTGKGTYSKLLQLELGRSLKLDVHEASDYFRAMAVSYGYPESELYKFNELRQKDKKLAREVDIRLDADILTKMMKEGGIFVGRLTFALAGERGFKIWLNCDSGVAAKRISLDPKRKEYGKPVSEIEVGLLRRDNADIRTYEELYEISYYGLTKRCNLFLDNSTGGKAENARNILEGVEPWLKGFK